MIPPARVPTSRQRRRRGLSLVETLISLAIVSMLLVAVGTAYQSAAAAISANDDFFRASQAARVSLGQVLAAIRKSAGCQVGDIADPDGSTVTAGNIHILDAAGEFLVYFHGQAYMGAVDAYLHALPFAVLGSSIGTLRLLPLVLSLVHVALCVVLARRVAGTGWWAAAGRRVRPGRRPAGRAQRPPRPDQRRRAARPGGRGQPSRRAATGPSIGLPAPGGRRSRGRRSRADGRSTRVRGGTAPST